MKSTAKLRYLRMSPRKVRLMADMIRGKNVAQAQLQLRHAPKKSSEPVLKTLRSAVAAAKNQYEVEEGNLYISKIVVGEGPKLKRYRARARGSAYPIQKKTSHVFIELEAADETQVKAKEAEKKPTQASSPAPDTTKRPEATKQETDRGRRQASAMPRNQERQKPRQATGIKKFFRRKAIG